MRFLIPITLFGSIPLAFALFAAMRPRRALITLFVLSWLFLPVAGINLPLIPLFDKRVAATLAALFAILVFDRGGLRQARLCWADAPMAVWCAVPFFTSLSNGLGAYDGLSAAVRHVILWGLPYWYGRCYIRDLDSVRDLALGLVAGGVVYIAFCLWELRMSPRLHLIVYGVRQHAWSQVFRFGGYRPMVFMEHGIMLSFWMATSALTALWISWSRSVRRVGPLPIAPCAITLLVIAVLCKSVGAILLLLAGLGVLWLSSLMRTRALAVLFVCVPPTYCAGRMTGLLTGDVIVEAVSNLSVARANSLAFRLRSEDLLMKRAFERPMLGWGGFSRSNPRDPETGRYMSVQDGMWIGALGTTGIVGLTALMLIGLIPLMLGLRVLGPASWRSPPLAPLAALLIVLALYTIDNLMNAMNNPLCMIIAGGATTIARRRLLAMRVRGPVSPGHAVGVGSSGGRIPSQR